MCLCTLDCPVDMCFCRVPIDPTDEALDEVHEDRGD